MAKINAFPDLFSRHYFGVRGMLFLLFLSLIFSCRNTKKEASGYSDAFKPVFDKVTADFATNRTKQGLRYLDSSMSRITSPNIDDRFRALSFHYVYWRKTKGDYKKALLCADSMLVLANKSVTQKQYVSNYVEANMAIGDAYFSMQQFDKAYRHYFEGFRVGKNNLDNRALSDYSYRMGMILYKMGHYKLAAGYFKESYKLCTPTNDPFADFYRQQEVLDNIGLSFKHNNEPDSADLYFDKALNYIAENTDRFRNRLGLIEVAKGVVYGNKAEVLIVQGKHKEAIDLLQKSIAINLQKGNDNSDAELAEIKLAQLYFDHNQLDELFPLLKALQMQFDSVKNDDAKAEWNRLMSKYYQRKNDFPKSLAYLQTYTNLNDSNTKKLSLLKESNVNEQLANFEKQYQIDNLKNNNKIQGTLLYTAVAGVLMAFVIIFLVFRNWKRSKHDVEIVNDLNRQVNLQKANLEKTLEELKSSDLEKDRILRTVAHDLRNPIGGIASLTLAMEDDDFTPEQKELIGLIKETSNNSLELINEILEVTNNGTTKLKKELVEINSLLTKSAELLRFKAAEKDQHIELELLKNPEEISINREKIWRVISNLISNAIKFSRKNGVINISVTDLKKDVEIAIKDHGIGIPDNMKPMIFNMFTEAKRSGTAGEKSFGLGLSICKQIIESHGGKIWFESKPGEGTTFFITLPKPASGKTTPSKTEHTNVLTT
ncbi:tetratricopeptide repeat-containing sensor histidine kinase [Mucilaginibacter sp.]|uniref:tetratricopeptide repeat-containing sensor histidine kinase n=1 Tax=Mucilaginibacter sp. TaxID=1882438 RepID=UPI00283AEF8A|nr:tetratricopeptide repeat-containing sensor histidine kinase [Mucilaginibacter sp.]MDR3694959.1 tetratricopeptide repeat-containing sensor histidine kinase [Mucilaginibacter sp.]